MKRISILFALVICFSITEAQTSGTEIYFGHATQSINSTVEPGAVVHWLIPRDYRGNVLLCFEGNASYPLLGFEIEAIIGAGFSVLAGPLMNLTEPDGSPGGQVLLSKKLFTHEETNFIIAAGARRHPGDNPNFGFISQLLFNFDFVDR